MIEATTIEGVKIEFNPQDIVVQYGDSPLRAFKTFVVNNSQGLEAGREYTMEYLPEKNCFNIVGEGL